jgi:peptidoglycan/xylan/chitin deacetylase (PgdA/CDA1 family)
MFNNRCNFDKQVVLHKVFLKLSTLFILGLSCILYTAQVLANPSYDVIATKDIHKQNLVILQYHHVSTATPNSTSVSPEDFAEHMDYLANNFKVIDLSEALSILQNDMELPQKSVAITFDDGFTNILENAHPILKKHNFPYTIFINPAIIGDSASQLDWQQIKEMMPLATFANHTLDHIHLLERYGNENEEQWLKRVMNDINQAEQIIEENIGYSKKWLAYPFGEYNPALKKAISDAGYIGFGQQSGAISTFSDFAALPRYPAAGFYANLNSLKTKLNSLAMPIGAVSPSNVEYMAGDTLETLKFKILHPDVRLDALACYFQGEKLKFSGLENNITVKVNHTLNPGRARINCTAPSAKTGNRYYWYSYPMFTATHEGEFLD